MKRTFTRGADTILLRCMYVCTYAVLSLGFLSRCAYVYIHMRLFARVYVCVCAHIDPPERARIDNTGPERGTLRPFYEYRISGKQYSILEHPLGAAIFTA